MASTSSGTNTNIEMSEIKLPMVRVTDIESAARGMADKLDNWYTLLNQAGISLSSEQGKMFDELIIKRL